MSSYQCILEEWHKEVPFTDLRMESRFGGTEINVRHSLLWTPDQVWSDDGSGCCFFVVIPAHDCRDAGGRAKRDARAEAGIQIWRCRN